MYMARIRLDSVVPPIRLLRRLSTQATSQDGVRPCPTLSAGATVWISAPRNMITHWMNKFYWFIIQAIVRETRSHHRNNDNRA